MDDWISTDLDLPLGRDHLLFVAGPDEVPYYCLGYWIPDKDTWMINGRIIQDSDKYRITVSHWKTLTLPKGKCRRQL